MVMKLEEYFTFYSKEVVRTRPNVPYIAGRICTNVDCKHKQKNESHYHCKFCDYSRRGRQNDRMEKHLISKHAHTIGLDKNHDAKSEEKSENGKYSVLDHSYTNGETVLIASGSTPAMLMLPHFSDREMTHSPHTNSLPTIENQENQHELNVVSPANSNGLETTTSNFGCTSGSGCNTDPLVPRMIGEEIIDRMLSDEQLLVSFTNSLPPYEGPLLNLNNGKSCVIPKCIHTNSKLKSLLRMKRQGSNNLVDWENTMLLLTYYKIDKTSSLSDKFICHMHWKEWYNFNYRLKKRVPLLG